jgi:hypothetical protein
MLLWCCCHCSYDSASGHVWLLLNAMFTALMYLSCTAFFIHVTCAKNCRCLILNIRANSIYTTYFIYAHIYAKHMPLICCIYVTHISHVWASYHSYRSHKSHICLIYGHIYAKHMLLISSIYATHTGHVCILYCSYMSHVSDHIWPNVILIRDIHVSHIYTYMIHTNAI